jgi:hypothetical protein
MKISNAKDKKPALDLRAPETTPNGQLLLNPNLTMDEATLFAKREYNRRNAARARYRTKGLQDTLQQKVYRLAQDTEKLQKERKELEKLISDLQTQNRQLIEDRTTYDNRNSFSFLADAAVPNHLLWTAPNTSQDHRESPFLHKLQDISSINNREQALAVDPLRTAIMILESMSPRLHLGSL